MAAFTTGFQLVLATVLAAFVAATIAADKGYPLGAGFVLGLGLPFVSVLFAVALPRRDARDDEA